MLPSAIWPFSLHFLTVTAFSLESVSKRKCGRRYSGKGVMLAGTLGFTQDKAALDSENSRCYIEKRTAYHQNRLTGCTLALPPYILGALIYLCRVQGSLCDRGVDNMAARWSINSFTWIFCLVPSDLRYRTVDWGRDVITRTLE